MRKNIWLWQILGFSVTALLGTVLHFLYEWLGGAAWIAPFSGVNESTWEHMKLLFWPMLLYAVAQGLFFRDYKDFWCVKIKGTLLGLGLIPAIFYLYNGIIGKSPDFVNIAIFFLSAAAAYAYESYLFNKKGPYCKSLLAIAAFCIIGAAFVIFTFVTPNIAIFMDPVTGSYGI